MKRTVSLIIYFLILSFTTAFAGEKEVAEDPYVTTAKKFLDQLVKKDFTNAVATFDKTMTDAMPTDKLGAVWDGLLQQLGAYKGLTDTKKELEEGYNVVYLTCDFEKSPIIMKVVYDKDQKIAGLFFLPKE